MLLWRGFSLMCNKVYMVSRVIDDMMNPIDQEVGTSNSQSSIVLVCQGT
jgi:hypothetical protein